MFQKSIVLYILYFFLGSLVCMSSCSPNHYGSKYSATKRKPVKERPRSQTDKSENYVYRKTEKKETPKVRSGNSNLTSTRSNIIDTAQKYIGSRYRSGGKNPETGFDCSGFTSFVFSQNGFPISGPSHDLAKMGKPKAREKLIPGDLVFFGNKERISHVAIVSSVDQNSMEVIHSTTSAGVKKDNIQNSEYWESRFLFGIDIINSK